jgi:hypothetical protein
MYYPINLTTQVGKKYYFVTHQKHLENFRLLGKVLNRDNIIFVTLKNTKSKFESNLLNNTLKYQKSLEYIFELFNGINNVMVEVISDLKSTFKFTITLNNQQVYYFIQDSDNVNNYAISDSEETIYNSSNCYYIKEYPCNQSGLVHKTDQFLGFYKWIDNRYCASCAYYDRTGAINCTVHPSVKRIETNDCKDKQEVM